jgi:hypothetical protein
MFAIAFDLVVAEAAIHHPRGVTAAYMDMRKALRAAITDDPFVVGEGPSSSARRELLGHSQRSLCL